MPILATRSQEEEIMDDLECSGEVVHQTLRELEIINRLLGGNGVTLQGLNALTRSWPKEKPLVIADLGCGGGDMLVRVAKWAKRKGFTVQLVGIDANPHIVAFAESNTKGWPQISYQAQDVFSETFASQHYHIVISSLFTHHFSEAQLAQGFAQWSAQASLGLVNNDLHRHWFAYWSIRLLTRFFSKSAMVRFDAPLSVARGFRKPELQSIMAKAGLKAYTLGWRWAFRWKLIIKNIA